MLVFIGDNKSVRRLVTGLMLVFLVSSSWGEPRVVSASQKMPTALSLMCTFAAQNQIFEISISLNEEQREGVLEVFDTRHKVVVERVRAPVQHENGFWVLRNARNSDAVATSREHRIGKTSFAYERNSVIQMGETPPLITADRGQCSRRLQRRGKGSAFDALLEEKEIVVHRGEK